MFRHTFTWSGWPGQTGYTRLYAQESGTAQAFANDSWAFMNDALVTGAHLPLNVKITQDPFVESMSAANGDVSGQVAIATNPVINGTNTSPWAAPAGAAVNWITNQFINGRRVRGRTYLVPLGGNCFDTTGTLADGIRTIIQNAGNSYIAKTTSTPVVWHRPTTPTGSDGSEVPITVASLADKAAVLTSRRD